VPIPDVLANTFPFGWRDIHAPCRAYDTHGSQDKAIHKRVDRDGGRIELQGRNPYSFRVQIIFLNGLTPGPNEKWGGDLYPGVYQQFVAAFEDRSTGTFVHPVFGPLQCKCTEFSDKLDAEGRSGVIVDALFEDTTDQEDAVLLGKLSPFSTATVAAGDLDAASSSSLSTPIQSLDPTDPGSSFSGFVSSVKGIGNTSDFLGGQFGGQITSAISTCNDIASTFSSQDAPNTQVRVVDAAYRLASSLRDIQNETLTKAKATGIYSVPRTTTLGALAGRLKNSVDDLMALNPSALSSPMVPSGSSISYYL
jgi:DNA circularisation protein N-terminus